MATPDVKLFSEVVQKMRSFFLVKGYVEVHTQDRLSILAACEDPDTVATYNYAGEIWPLPQTGQMWLEYELLTKPELPGVFCVSTSYRQEPRPVPGRHNIVFPMFEFESHGTLDDLRKLEIELLVYMGFGQESDFKHFTYKELAQKYNVDELTNEHENKMDKEIAHNTFIEYFPETTSPFWNMKRKDEESANKIDVIMYGMETIGSAERETDKTIMRERFETISNGGYAQKLYDLFGKERVQKELNEFLELDFFPRFGGGIGMTRMMRAYKISKEE
jgi:aspartyl/asparaginyl-tRNA synthetase